MKRYVFIPIKGHSERVPRKNFREFCGNPLYIHTLKKYDGLDVELWVDTDNDEIAQEINNRKAKGEFKNIFVKKRKNDLCGDSVPVNSLINDFIFTNVEDYNTWITQIHVTHPFLTASTVLKAIDSVLSYGDKYDSVASVNKLQTRLWREEKYGFCPVNHNPMKLEKTQDLPVFYEENSCFYIFNTYHFMNRNCGRRVGIAPMFVETNFPENLDIDTEEDMKRCLELSKIL